MSQIEFVASQGYAFTVALRNPNAAYASLATGLAVTQVTPGVYRCATGSVTGVVYVEATAGALRVVGFANLDEPGANGYSEVFDNLAEAAGTSATVVVTPLQLEQRERARGNNVSLVTGETPLAAFDVLADGDGNIPDLDALTLEVVIETINKATRLTIPNASITRNVVGSGENVTAASVVSRWPSGVTTNPSEWRWSLRETANDGHLAGGLVTVTYEP
jgi:hypothetical protein